MTRTPVRRTIIAAAEQRNAGKKVIMMAFPSWNDEPSLLQRQTAMMNDAHTIRCACPSWLSEL